MSSMLWDAAAAAAAFAVVQILMARRSVRPLEAAQASKDSVSVDPNRPTDSRGRTFHLQITPADVAPRILSVGDAGRAERISTQFDGGRATRKVVSSRGFITFTGNYRGVPISIIATGMGSSMMDFVVREARQVLTGPVAILRLGTCGGLRETTAGTVVVAEKGALFIRREPDLVASRLTTSSSSKDNELPYSFSELALPNAQLATLYASKLRMHLEAACGPPFKVVAGVNASADSFYGSQGRPSDTFHDFNEPLLEHLESTTAAISLEMETFTLHDLARSACASTPIAACGAAIVIWNRREGTMLAAEQLETAEARGGAAALDTLASWYL